MIPFWAWGIITWLVFRNPLDRKLIGILVSLLWLTAVVMP